MADRVDAVTSPIMALSGIRVTIVASNVEPISRNNTVRVIVVQKPCHIFHSGDVEDLGPR
jgi:hypothetical protein